MLSKKFDFFKRSKARTDTKYKCLQCEKEYVYLKSLENHYKIVHNEFKSIMHQVECFRNDLIIRNEDMVKLIEPLGPPSSPSAAVQSKPSRSYSIACKFICSWCRIEEDNHQVIQTHIEKDHKGKEDQFTIRVLCAKCWTSFETENKCKQHQWDEHIKENQVEFPGTCCEFGCMEKYADLGELAVHHNRHVHLTMESGQPWNESIRKTTNWNSQFGCLDKCDTIEQLIEKHNNHGGVSKPTKTATSETQIVIDHKEQAKTESTKVDTTGAKQIIININQFNRPQQSVTVEKNKGKTDFDNLKQNTTTKRPKYTDNVYTRNRESIRCDPPSKHYNLLYDVDNRAQFGNHLSPTSTETEPTKPSTDTNYANE